MTPAELVSGATPSQVRVQLHDGRRVVLRRPTLRADSLVSGRPGDSSAVAVAEVDRIAVRKFDTPRTLGLTVLMVGVPFALCAATCEFGPSFNLQ